MTIKNVYSVCIAKVLSFAVLVVFSALASSNSSVWKVSKNNDHVFIGGTIHVLPEGEFPLPVEFMNAYQNTDKVILEAQLPDPTDMEAQQAMLAQMSYSNGKNLQNVLTPTIYKMLGKYFEAMEINLEQFIGFKPGFVVSIMALIELQKSDISGEGVDVFFENLATKDSREIGYLESAEFQFKMLGELGEGYEDEFIKANIEINSSFTDFFQNTLDAWRSGNAKKLEALINDASFESDAKSYDALFTQRNKNWVPKIEALFNNKNKEFVLVGAGHLFGRDGLLTLLKNKGYIVEQKSL